MNTTPQKWSSQTKLVVSLLLLALGIYFLARFSQVIPALVLSFVLAYILSPLVNNIQKRLKMRRGLATGLGFLIMLVVLITLPVLMLEPLGEQIGVMNVDVQQVTLYVENLLGRTFNIGGLAFDGMAAVRQVEVAFQGLIQPFFTQTVNVLVNVLSSLVWMIFIVVVSFYLVKDSDSLREWAESRVPPTYRNDFICLRDEINRIWSAFFRGQLTLALIVLTLFSIIGWIIGIPFALAMGILAGVLEFLPSIGHGIWLVLAAFLSLSVGSTWLPLPNWIFMLIVIGLHLIYQQFDLNYLIPRIIGRSVHLPPLVVILGIVAGASMAGVIGIALAAPTIASLRVLLSYIFANLFDLGTFPETVVSPLPPPNPRWWQTAPGEKHAEEGQT